MTDVRPTASDIHLGGSTVSVSMLGTWWRCPKLWYFTYLHPYGETTGIETKYTGSPLMIGSGVHIGLTAYYSAGPEGPDWSMDAGLDAARRMFAARRDEFESDERWAADLAETERILRGYATEYAREWPDLKPLAIERTYSLTLRSGHILSVRPDMMAENFGMLVAVEHKVPGANKVVSTIGSASLGAQGLVQAAVLRAHDMPTNGQLLNILVRGDYRKLKAGTMYTTPTKPYQRHVIDFAPVSVDYILDLASRTCNDIMAAVYRWGLLRDDGMAPLEAARVAFPMAGLFNGMCHQGFRPCDMALLCGAPGREQSTLAINYRVRTYKSDVPAETTE